MNNKSWWAELLEHSVAAATIIVLTISAVALLLVVGIATIIFKIALFIK